VFSVRCRTCCSICCSMYVFYMLRRAYMHWPNMFARVFVCLYACLCVCVCMHACTCACMRSCMCVYMHVCMCTHAFSDLELDCHCVSKEKENTQAYIYTYTHTRTHTHIHTHTPNEVRGDDAAIYHMGSVLGTEYSSHMIYVTSHVISVYLSTWSFTVYQTKTNTSHIGLCLQTVHRSSKMLQAITHRHDVCVTYWEKESTVYSVSLANGPWFGSFLL